MSLLEANGVTRSYGGIHALRGCSFRVEEGEIAGLIGPNGSGKTTLFNLVTGYEQVDAGQIRFRGRNVTNSQPDKIFALGLGRTFQLTRIFPRLTVIENLHVAAQRRGLRGLLGRWSSSREHARSMDLLEFVGLNEFREKPAGNLSYGQKKLLEFASILAAEPSVILLDEPAGGVNPIMIAYLADRIRELNKQGVTFLVVEHNMEFVMGLCHRVSVMHRGERIAEGSPETIRQDPNVLAAYLGD